MILVIDNYDSFVWNLVQALRVLGHEVVVARNDALSVEEALALEPERIVISPGPRAPRDAGISTGLARAAGERGVPVLGVCLGHQCLGEAFGARVVRARRPLHGSASLIRHDGRGIFAGVPSPFLAARYHSLAVSESRLPRALVATAWADDGTLMGLRHRELPVHGVQFHPESYLTEHGERLLANFAGSLSPRERASHRPSSLRS
ncbi:aminodeoxychorismate/anthranilate synthase component II [bacterium]|nr:aminodeoxychorismate/anthranilate synthase component II [bacterium]